MTETHVVHAFAAPVRSPALVPGWYLDPSDVRHHRYWTGEEWQSEDQRLGLPAQRSQAVPSRSRSMLR